MATFSYTNLPVVGSSSAYEAANRIVTSFTELATFVNGANFGTAQIANQAITTAKLDQTVGAQAVTTETLRNSSVNSDKLATDAVITSKILNNNVTGAKLSSVPFAIARRSAAVSVNVTTSPSGSFILVPMDTSVVENEPDGIGTMVDTANGRIYVRRAGVYQLQGDVTLGSTYTSNSGTALLTCIYHNTVVGGTTYTRIVASANQTGNWSGAEITASCSGIYNAAAGDYFTLGFRHNGNANFATVNRSDVPNTAGNPTTWMTPYLRVAWLGKIANS